MYVNIVELCKVTDKNASYYVQNATAEGRKVYTLNGSYVVTVADNLYWRAEDAQYRSVPDGLYVFRNNEVYYVQ